MIIAIISALALIGLGCVLMSIGAIGLFLMAGKHGQERRYPVGDGEPDEPLERRLNRLYEPLAENGTDEKEQQ